MYYHEGHGIVFFLPPRTASRAVEAVLRKRGFTPRMSRHEICRKTFKEEGANIREVLCTVRNHLDTVVSWWSREAPGLKASGVNHVEDFGFWLLAKFLKFDGQPWAWVDRDPPYAWLWRRWTSKATRLIRYERLVEDLDEALPFEVRPEDLAEKITESQDWRKGRPWREFFTRPELLGPVLGLFYPEMKELGYLPDLLVDGDPTADPGAFSGLWKLVEGEPRGEAPEDGGGILTTEDIDRACEAMDRNFQAWCDLWKEGKR